MSDIGALLPAIVMSVFLIGVLAAAHLEARRLAAHRARRAEAEQAAHFAE